MWWWQAHKPRTDAERAAEITRLSQQRDRLLDRAPMEVVMRQAVLGCSLAVMLMMFLRPILAGTASWKGWLPVIAIAAGLIAVIYRSRHLPAAGDQWANSRLLGYDGDSPQDLQDRIDRLRAEISDGQ
jgi:hypothetical protein